MNSFEISKDQNDFDSKSFIGKKSADMKRPGTSKKQFRIAESNDTNSGDVTARSSKTPTPKNCYVKLMKLSANQIFVS